jgi:hypothetical protein
MGKLFGTTAVVIVLGVILQFFQPVKTNPITDPALSVTQQTAVPGKVADLLQAACRDCHTNNTIWPLHSYISPISWLVDYDVHEGRDRLNFSRWGEYESQRAWVLLDAVCSQLQNDRMPPKRYLLVHQEARLSDSDKETICKWTREAKEIYQ